MDRGETLLATEYAAAIDDAYPLSVGHSLIVTRRHVATLLDASPEESRACWALVNSLVAFLRDRHEPDGFNVGMNLGAAAGQTVDHVHIHVIPRYRGDVDDPRGGIRWVLPAKANYWE